MENEDIYHKAAQKVKAKKGFFYHLIAYAGVLAMLYFIIKVENNGNMLPVIIVALSWGIGIATHYFSTFGTEHLDFLGFSSNWEEEELEKEVEKIKRTRELRERAKYERDSLDELDELELRQFEKRTLDRDYE